jgi:hypothetical protein
MLFLNEVMLCMDHVTVHMHKGELEAWGAVQGWVFPKLF